MAKVKITPDAELASTEAVRIRISQLEKELATTQNPADSKPLSRRIKILQDRLSMGQAGKTAANPRLLISKNDLL